MVVAVWHLRGAASSPVALTCLGVPRSVESRQGTLQDLRDTAPLPERVHPGAARYQEAVAALALADVCLASTHAPVQVLPRACGSHADVAPLLRGHRDPLHPCAHLRQVCGAVCRRSPCHRLAARRCSGFVRAACAGGRRQVVATPAERGAAQIRFDAATTQCSPQCIPLRAAT
eukprot:6485936-Prymnesium_polylepis.2